MGARGPAPSFTNIACPNRRCRGHGQLGEGNVVGNGRYRTRSGLVRNFLCRRCGKSFCARSETAFYDLRSPEDKVLLALQLVLRGMALRAVAGALEVKLDTVRFWLAQAAAHADNVNDALVKQVQVQRVELDELWTFVRKKNFRAWQRARRATMARPGSGSRSRPNRA
jgi:transposase-like protein